MIINKLGFLVPRHVHVGKTVSDVYSSVKTYRGPVPFTKKDKKIAKKLAEDRAYVCAKIRQRKDLFDGVHVAEVPVTEEYINLTCGVPRVRENFLLDWTIKYARFKRKASNGVASCFYLPAK
jgi:hypothetical protein